jgi:hypothetical protein
MTLEKWLKFIIGTFSTVSSVVFNIGKVYTIQGIDTFKWKARPLPLAKRRNLVKNAD